jgi:hypothetical protein
MSIIRKSVRRTCELAAVATLIAAAMHPGNANAKCSADDYLALWAERRDSRPSPRDPRDDPNRRFVPRIDYPRQVPASSNPVPRFDPDNWQGWMRAVLAYSMQGNIEVDFDIKRNTIRNWYHAVWMHSGGAASRERLRGLTRERGPDSFDLAPFEVKDRQAWAIGFYNDIAAQTFARVYGDDYCDPRPESVTFAEGSVTFKLLFVDAGVRQFPFLAGAPIWQAHINADEKPRDNANERTTRDVTLAQLDIAVRTDAAGKTGWVFGTFVYRSDAVPRGANWLDSMVPLSMSWSDDPTAAAGQPLPGTRIDPAMQGLTHGWPQRQALGYAGRANGPVDNPLSSCISCHGTARYPRSPAYGNWPVRNNKMTDSELRQIYFSDIRPGELFDPQRGSGAVALDYSLQMQAGLEHLCNQVPWLTARGRPEPRICAQAKQALEFSAPLATHAGTLRPTSRGDVSRDR